MSVNQPHIPDVMHKVGSFTIPIDEMVRKFDRIKHIFAQVVVTRCEFIYNPYGGVFVYEAISDQFKKVKEGEQPRRYIARWNEKTESYDFFDKETIDTIMSKTPPLTLTKQ